MTNNEKIISRINDVRGNVSVNAFSKQIGVKQKALDMYLKNERKPSVELIYCVCSNCSVSADWLLGLPVAPSASGGASSVRPASADAEKIRQLEDEVARLRGENEGLKYALLAMNSKEGVSPKRVRTVGASA